MTLRSHQNVEKPKENIEIELSEPVSLTFSLKYLVNFCKASALSEQVKICLSNEVPLLVEYGVQGNSYLRFYLAPKVSLYIPDLCPVPEYYANKFSTKRLVTTSNCLEGGFDVRARIGVMWQQCLAVGDSPVQLVSSDSATDIMLPGWLAWLTPPRAEIYCPRSCYRRNCENWRRRASVWALQDNALFIIIERRKCSSIMFNTIFDGNEKQEHKESCLKHTILGVCPERGCTNDRRAVRGSSMQADRVATWGASKPLPRSPGLIQDHRHRAGQSAGHFFGCDRHAIAVCVIRNF